MKFIIPFLVAALPVAAVAQSQSGQAPGASGVMLPKTTEVMVILTARQGVTRQQIMAIMPSEIRDTVKLISMGKSAGGIRGATARASSSSSTRRPKMRPERSWKRCRSQKNT